MEDALVTAIAQAIPPYNTHLLKDYTEQQINRAPHFIDQTFRQAVKLLHGAITYEDYHVLNPYERAKFELDPANRLGPSIAVSELQLYRYDFRWKNQPYHIHLYMPYLKDGLIVINDKRYAVQRAITEQIFARSNDGVTVRVIRARLAFIRNQMLKFESATSGLHYQEFLYFTTLYLGTHRKAIKLTVLHYLLARFGWDHTLARFGYDRDDISFSPVIAGDGDRYDYFVAKKVGKGVCDVYLKVRRELMEDELNRKFVANILYTLTKFARHTAHELLDPKESAKVFRIMMGRALKGDQIQEGQIDAQMQAHISSLNSFFDEITKARFANFDVHIDDIYGLLEYVFRNLDRIMVHSTHHDLYSKRIDILDGILIKLFVTLIYNKFYAAEPNAHRLVEREVKTLLSLPPMHIAKIHGSPNIVSAPAIFNESYLTSCAIKKSRQNGSGSRKLPNPSAPENRLHPSIAVVETLVAFAGASPGAGGNINPCLQITEAGGVIRPDYAEDVEGISRYLPY